MAPRPGILDPSTNNPFAHPSGWLGRLAGWFMLWNNKHDERGRRPRGATRGRRPRDRLRSGRSDPATRRTHRRGEHPRGRPVPGDARPSQATQPEGRPQRPGSAGPRYGGPDRPSRRQRRPRGLGEQRGDLARSRGRCGRAVPGRSSGRQRRHRLARRHETVPDRQVPPPAGRRARPHRAACCGIASPRSAVASCRASTYSPPHAEPFRSR